MTAKAIAYIMNNEFRIKNLSKIQANSIRAGYLLALVDMGIISAEESFTIAFTFAKTKETPAECDRRGIE